MTKLESIDNQMAKNKEKILALQKKNRALELQRKNVENEEFTKVVKAINIPVSEIAIIMKAYAAGEIEIPEDIRELIEEEENDEE